MPGADLSRAGTVIKNEKNKMNEMNEDGKIIFKDEEGREDVYYIVEETKLGNVSYLLVTDTPESEQTEEADAFILKDISSPDSEEAVYEFVDDDRELDALADVFAELLEDDVDLT